MKKMIFAFGLLVSGFSLFAQNTYQFKTEVDLEATPVISQGRTGTCWSFSASSFVESEIIRLTGKTIDISEMFTVRNTYPKKADNYVLRLGKAQFSEGGLAHDVMNVITTHGLVPNSAFNGLDEGESGHNHAEMIAVLSSMLDTYVDAPAGELSPKWRAVVDGVLDAYLGENVTSFEYEGKSYTPQSFAEMTKIRPENYLHLTSFNHVDYYSNFILNIPDNWSNGSFYNLPLDEFIQTLDNALENGYTVEFDCDVSEKTFSSKNGVAIIPENEDDQEKGMTEVVKEMDVTQDYRQQEFENFRTTDDHLMHITGMLKDQNGTKYYKVKNSWGTDANRVANGGYVYMSEAYMKLKTISITIHKDALPKKIGGKLAMK